MMDAPGALARLNALDRAAFTAALGGVFEGSPWVAEAAFAERPFASLAALHEAMMAVVRKAPRWRRLALLRAHPDLAGKAARSGRLTVDSRAEQASAGLDRLTDDEYIRFDRMNAAYRRKFGFPFIVCVRNHGKESILAAFERRLGNDSDAEVSAAVEEVGTIARLRLEALD